MTAQTPVQTRQVGTATLENVPPIPADVRAAVQRYQNYREAVFRDWLPDGSILITTRFGATNQVHRVAAPGAARTQLTFFDEPVAQCRDDPRHQPLRHHPRHRRRRMVPALRDGPDRRSRRADRARHPQPGRRLQQGRPPGRLVARHQGLGRLCHPHRRPGQSGEPPRRLPGQGLDLPGGHLRRQVAHPDRPRHLQPRDPPVDPRPRHRPGDRASLDQRPGAL